MDLTAVVAFIRFGLGRRGAEPVPGDPASWLATQLEEPDPALARAGASAADGLLARRAGGPSRVRDLFRAERAAALQTLVTSATPLRERLVWFWANHFAISLRRGGLRAVGLAYVREAIRPHVTGRFADMLLAVARHPAMLLYLDNASSIGPDSPAGRRRGRGLNENYARECLELHTVGRDAGYTQADVTAFAQVLTGWGIDMAAAAPGFAFFPDRHQPGAKVVMGQEFPPGEAGGVAALAWLGTHPASYRRVARKLVRHFVADDPPAAAVQRLAGVLHATGGDLKAAALALVKMPAAWQPLGKLRTPADYAVAVLRALDLPAAAQENLPAAMARLGQPFLAPPLPDGWPDEAAAWADGELLLRRADWAAALAGEALEADPFSLAEASLGPLLGADTARALRRAGGRREALALLLASPEFLRR